MHEKICNQMYKILKTGSAGRTVLIPGDPAKNNILLTNITTKFFFVF